MSKKIRAAVVGCGILGTRHAEIYSEMPEVELVAVCDRHEDRAKNLSTRLNTTGCMDLTPHIAAIDVVSVCTPAATHYDVAMDLLRRGLHLLIEKPIATRLDHADALVEEAGKRNLILQTGHIERFNAAFKTIKQMVRDPLFIECDRIGPYDARVQDVGVVLDLMIHDIDILLSFLDSKIRHIDAIGHRIMSATEDFANCRILFENGTVCNMTASRIARDRLRKIRIFQQNAYFSLDYIRQEAILMTKDGSQTDYQTIAISKTEPLKEEIKDFIDCVRRGEKPIVSGLEGRAALAIALQILDQISTQERISASL